MCFAVYLLVQIWQSIAHHVASQVVPAKARDVVDAGLIPGLGRSLEEGIATHSSSLA